MLESTLNWIDWEDRDRFFMKGGSEREDIFLWGDWLVGFEVNFGMGIEVGD